MTSTHEAETGGRRPRNLRPWILLGLILAIVLVVAGIAALWLFFFGSEAPPAPTLDDALGALATAVPSPAE